MGMLARILPNVKRERRRSIAACMGGRSLSVHRMALKAEERLSAGDAKKSVPKYRGGSPSRNIVEAVTNGCLTPQRLTSAAIISVEKRLRVIAVKQLIERRSKRRVP